MTFREGRPGRKVRIVKRRIPSGVAGLSLAAVALTAVLAFGAWRWWRTEQAPIITEPVLEEAELNWKCDQGHYFVSQGQIGGQPCTICREMAYPVTTYACPTHGDYEVRVQFGRNDDGAAVPVLHRVQNGPWVAVDGGPQCPKCGTTMIRRDADPLKGLVKPKRRSSAP